MLSNLLIAVLWGILAFVIANFFMEAGLAALIGLVVGVLAYLNPVGV